MNIIDYLYWKKYFKDGEFRVEDLPSIFDEYTEKTIWSRKDLFKNHDDFRAFLYKQKDKFKLSMEDDMKFGAKIRKASMLNYITSPRQFEHQNAFAEIVMRKLGKKKDISIMEVACGTIPYASMVLAEQYGLVTAIDSQLTKGLSSKTLMNLNVFGIEDKFDNTTYIDNSDYIIAQCPCPSTEDIVEICMENNKPFIISSCDCPPAPDCGWPEYFKQKYGNDIKAEDNLVYSL